MTPTDRQRADELLDGAREALEAGDYRLARERAEEARELAQQAGYR